MNIQIINKLLEHHLYLYYSNTYIITWYPKPHNRQQSATVNVRCFLKFDLSQCPKEELVNYVV